MHVPLSYLPPFGSIDATDSQSAIPISRRSLSATAFAIHNTTTAIGSDSVDNADSGDFRGRIYTCAHRLPAGEHPDFHQPLNFPVMQWT